MNTANLDRPYLSGFFLSGNKPPVSPVAVKPESKSVELDPQQPKRIFVIDDEAAIADSLAEILNGAGYDATAFHSGHIAIDSARQVCPDIVLADVVMPKLNGVEVVLMIQELCAATRIILFSGQAGTANILQEARTKGHEFELLPKPIHPDQLLKRLSSAGSS